MQTVMTQAPAEAVEGHIADQTSKDIVTGIATQDIPFGRGVFMTDATDNPATIALTNSTGVITDGSFLGVSVRELTLEANENGVNVHADESLVPVLRRGRIYVKCETAITALGVQAFVRFTANTTPTRPIGQFLGDADTDKAVALPGARFITLCGAGELAILELAPEAP